MKTYNSKKSEGPVEMALKFGLGKLSDQELLALIIYSGNKNRSAFELAGDVIAANKEGIKYLPNCEIEELLSLTGIGPVKATRILAAAELGKRISTAESQDVNYIENSRDVASLFMEDLRYKTKEYFKTLLLNTKGRILCIDTVSIGNLNQTTVHPREVFKKAIKRGAASLIIIHNHPSGDPTPSNEDIVTTRRLSEVGKLVGIPVLDHVIIGDGDYVSFKHEGLMD